MYCALITSKPFFYALNAVYCELKEQFLTTSTTSSFLYLATYLSFMSHRTVGALIIFVKLTIMLTHSFPICLIFIFVPYFHSFMPPQKIRHYFFIFSLKTKIEKLGTKNEKLV